MAVGYVVCNMIWPNFYFSHNEIGKNAWLGGQLVFISVFIYGLWTPVGSIKSNYLRRPNEMENNVVNAL